MIILIMIVIIVALMFITTAGTLEYDAGSGRVSMVQRVKLWYEKKYGQEKSE